MAAWSALPEDPDVREQVALLMVARAQMEAAHASERGDQAVTRQWLGTARELAQGVACSPLMAAEMVALDGLEAALNDGKNQAFVKGAKYRSYSRKQTQSPIVPKPPGNQPPTES